MCTQYASVYIEEEFRNRYTKKVNYGGTHKAYLFSLYFTP